MKDVLPLINRILDIDQKLSGMEYLKVFVKNISKILDMKYVLIAHPLDNDCKKVQTDVIWGGDDYIENFEYDLENTPCQVVLTGERVCIHDCGVASLYPNDEILKELEIEAYIGAPVARYDNNDISSILILLDIKPIKDKDFISSITEFLALRASAEIERFHNEEILVSLVQERTHDLELANKELKNTISTLRKTQKKLIESEKMASLGNLVTGVAHEINTPVGIGLTGITHLLSISDEIKKKYEEDNITQEEFEGYLKNTNELSNQIFKNIEKTVTLVNNFKQLAVDRSSEEKRKFNLKNYLEKILDSLQTITKKTNITISIECDDIEIDSYPGVYSQIISNLIINSIKHAYSKNEKGHIFVILHVRNNNLSLIYKDDGKGISSEYSEKIFDPFFTTNRKEGAIGLGLNIVYNLVTGSLNGSISYKSECGKGLLFKIDVPL